ncbi:hypothetical protein [Ochrobactrum sp. MYb379]|uniref:hypothetical protein n=1 Tax=Ochrobactrum sp. MYb379 TaxID=2745275 RepID=UPI00309B4CD3
MNNADQRTDRYYQHGFMLVVTCVLSFAAFLFAIDLSALGGETSRALPGKMAAQQIDSAPALPPRQQSTPATQPMRAVLTDAIAAKIKAAYPHGNGDGIATFSSDIVLYDGQPVEAATSPHFLRLSQSSYASARAPPAMV